MRAHRLKTWPDPFLHVAAGRKTCELRRADRDFRVGDFLLLVEFDPRHDQMTGSYLYRKITHILTPGDPPRGLIEGHVILSIEPCDQFDIEVLQGGSNVIHPGKVEWLAPVNTVSVKETP